MQSTAWIEVEKRGDGLARTGARVREMGLPSAKGARN